MYTLYYIYVMVLISSAEYIIHILIQYMYVETYVGKHTFRSLHIVEIILCVTETIRPPCRHCPRIVRNDSKIPCLFAVFFFDHYVLWIFERKKKRPTAKRMIIHWNYGIFSHLSWFRVVTTFLFSMFYEYNST